MIKPQNLTAQLHYRGRGNPPNSQPVSAISNCFPGLEMDFRAIWRRMFVGIVLIENNNYVLEGDPAFEDLIHHRLLLVDDFPTGVATSGVVNPNFPPAPLSTGSNPNGVSFMEWSNSLARIMAKQGQKVRAITGCGVGCPATSVTSKKRRTSRSRYSNGFGSFLSKSTSVSDLSGVKPHANPGELTQGLCSPWHGRTTIANAPVTIGRQAGRTTSTWWPSGFIHQPFPVRNGTTTPTSAVADKSTIAPRAMVSLTSVM
jgi:hypothetical protein